jgi:hypothetical protein
MTLRNVISYSVWGAERRYNVGMLRNLELCSRFYPGWQVKIYCDRGAYDFLSKARIAGEMLEETADDYWCPRMMQRFLIADDPTVGRFLSRDADSRITLREAKAVEEWIREGTILHCLHDHPHHHFPIMGGMWGMVPRQAGWEMPKMSGLIQGYLSKPRSLPTGAYFEDQHFLHEIVWPLTRHSVTRHSSVHRELFPDGKSFPLKREWPRFVGEVFLVDDSGNEAPRADDWKQIASDFE